MQAVPLLVVIVLCQYWWTDELWRFDPPADLPVTEPRSDARSDLRRVVLAAVCT